MANGLICSETLVSTPKYRHDSNSENCPPEYKEIKSYQLLCQEVLQESELKPLNVPSKQIYENFQHPPVKADCDTIILKDDRVLQNLLKNEDRYTPTPSEYFSKVQIEIKPHMRKIVSDWMLEVCQELCCQPEVFCLAMNLMDRFLAVCRINKSQLQLLGAACLFLGSKFRSLEHISSDKLVMYTDYSCTIQELKDWELLILTKLRWELSSTIPLDYLDHILPRLHLPSHIDIHRLRIKTETILALAATHIKFSCQLPSVLAAASILTALNSCQQETKNLESDLRLGRRTDSDEVSEKLLRCTRLCLQGLTYAGSDILDEVCRDLCESIPGYLTGHVPSSSQSPDTSSITSTQPLHMLSPVPYPATSFNPTTCSSSSPSSSSPSSSTLDIFSEFQSVFNQQDQSYSGDAHVSNSILVT